MKPAYTVPGALILLALSAGCGQKQNTTPDAGVDTSCGIDCAAQERYGLIANRCFEYTDGASAVDPAALGVQVGEAKDVEGVKVIPVEYRQAGQIKMTDLFMLKDGSLLLARRTFGPGDSVTYRDATGAIQGVTWFGPTTGVGENYATTSRANVIAGGQNTIEDVTLHVNTLAPTTAEQTVPAGTYDQAVKILFSETPDHGMDARRVFAPGTGFTLFSSRFSMSATDTAQEFRLQKVRDLGVGDGGDTPCGFGSP